MIKRFIILVLTALAVGSFTGCSDSSSEPGGSTAHLDYSSSIIGTLKYVPAGRFQRDSTPGNISVVSKPFRMSRYEITRAQFARLMKAEPVLMENRQNQSSGTTDPVFMVNWYHAITFCNKLSLQDNLTPVYRVVKNGILVDWNTVKFSDVPLVDDTDWNNATATWTNDGYRLPTEMEWMWAAMGAPATGRGRDPDTNGHRKSYAGSTEGSNSSRLGSYAWYTNNANNKTHPVGTKKPNELGLYDMTGNVTELCWDRWSTTPETGLLTDYRGPASGEYRVVKGGSRADEADDVALIENSNPHPYFRNQSIGFRVVRR